MEVILSASCRQVAYPVTDASHVAATRRAANHLANRQGFDESAAGRAALVITEAATNILKHAGQGEILLRPLSEGEITGMEILALDQGPGMASTRMSMQDGYSTAGTYGVGLGAIGRQSDEFDIYAPPGCGTALRMAIWSKSVPPPLEWQLGAVCLPIAGEDMCGDAWAAGLDESAASLLVADGLGHGILAAEASEAAARLMVRYSEQPPASMLERCHDALRSTRGAAVSVVSVDTEKQELRFAGVGNVAGYILSDEGRRQMVSHNGIVGSNMQKAQEYAVRFSDNSMLILHSDGLASRWDLEKYPGLLRQHPSLIAAVLYRDFSRKRDDVSILVLRYGG